MSQEDESPENVAKQINEHINNGGGCAEVWEATTEIRDQNRSGRRDFIKRTTAAAGIALAGVRTVFAKGVTEHNLQEVNLKAILASNQVQLILKSLNEPTVSLKKLSQKLRLMMMDLERYQLEYQLLWARLSL